MGKMRGTETRRGTRTRSQAVDDSQSQGVLGSQGQSGSGKTPSSQSRQKPGKDFDGDFYPPAKKKGKKDFSTNKQIPDKLGEDSSGSDEEDGAKLPNITGTNIVPRTEQSTGAVLGEEGSPDMIPATENHQQVTKQTGISSIVTGRNAISDVIISPCISRLQRGGRRSVSRPLQMLSKVDQLKKAT